MPTEGRVTMSYQAIEQIAQLPSVRRACAQRADRIAGLAHDIATAAGMPNLPITRTDGTRPRGRPYSEVSAPLAPEYGTSTMTRLSILGLAVARS